MNMTLQPYDDNLGLTLGYNFDDFTLNTGGSRIDWQSVINQGFGITSQILASRGKYPTQQIGAGGTPIGGGYSPAAQLQAQAQVQQAIAQQSANQAVGLRGGNGGVGLDDAATSITSFVQRNPLLVGGGVLALYLLMREPPRRR